jgi:hypothetical protein
MRKFKVKKFKVQSSRFKNKDKKSKC